MRQIFDAVTAFGPILAIKLYRLPLDAPATVPTLPCLDHEAKLHDTVAPHVSVYLQDQVSGELHEVAFMPSRQQIDIDAASTLGEHTEASRARLLALLRDRFPGYHIRVHEPSRWRGERRVAAACRAQLTLREVLTGTDFERLGRRVHRLQIVGTLMEKPSRVASWGVRTVTGPVLAAVGFLAYELLGSIALRIGDTAVSQLRYGVVGLLGAVFLYYGLKAVQLTDMANQVWKRSAEYSLILAGRQRLAGSQQ